MQALQKSVHFLEKRKDATKFHILSLEGFVVILETRGLALPWGEAFSYPLSDYFSDISPFSNFFIFQNLSQKRIILENYLIPQIFVKKKRNKINYLIFKQFQNKKKWLRNDSKFERHLYSRTWNVQWEFIVNRISNEFFGSGKLVCQ